MFRVLVGKSYWRHSGQRAEERHASWNPKHSVSAGFGTFPSILLACSPALSWPSVPKKHFQDLIITQDTTVRAAVSEAQGKTVLKVSLWERKPDYEEQQNSWGFIKLVGCGFGIRSPRVSHWYFYGFYHGETRSAEERRREKTKKKLT